MNASTTKVWKTGALLILATMVLVFAASALAQGSGGRFGQGKGHGRSLGDGQFVPEHRMEKLKEKLELSDEQAAAIETIRQAGREKSVALRKEMMRLRNELKGEMLKDEPSEKTALSLVDKIGALKTELQANRMKNRLEVRRQLTPQQRDKMLMRHGSFERDHGRKGSRHGGGQCDRECDGSGPGHRTRGQRG